MSKSILLLLLLIDITVPILACIILSTVFQSTALFEFMLFGLISGILFFIFQLINSDYDNFYLSHLNQKLRLTAISWIKSKFYNITVSIDLCRRRLYRYKSIIDMVCSDSIHGSFFKVFGQTLSV